LEHNNIETTNSNQKINAVSELNHQHVYAEIDSTTNNALQDTYIGYPVAWCSKISGQTEFTKDNLSSLLIPIPPGWRPVVSGTKYISLSEVSQLDSAVLQNVLGK
jgi:hypothetical protein